jgi:hypothetical protein
MNMRCTQFRVRLTHEIMSVLSAWIGNQGWLAISTRDWVDHHDATAAERTVVRTSGAVQSAATAAATSSTRDSAAGFAASIGRSVVDATAPALSSPETNAAQYSAYSAYRASTGSGSGSGSGSDSSSHAT